jgi:hypothetical protein
MNFSSYCQQNINKGSHFDLQNPVIYAIIKEIYGMMIRDGQRKKIEKN